MGVGTYSCAISDANSCSVTKTVSILTSGAPTATVTSQTNVSCNGLCNGSATVNASGGSTPYSYSWSNGSITSIVNGLCAGPYSCTVTGSNGCSVITSVTITQPAPLLGNATASSILCNGGISSVTVSATGGTTAYTGVGTFTALAGTKTYTITDANSCTTTASIVISQPSILLANATASSILCNGGVSTVTVTATGGTTAYSGVGTFTTIAGTKTYTITDANSCSTTASVVISQPAVLSANATASSILCNGGVSTVTVTATGGATGYSGVGTFTALAGNQTYTITDANSCVTTTTISISEPMVLSAGSSASSILCNGGVANITVTASGGTPSYTGIGTFTAMAGSSSYTVTDANGCATSTSLNVSEPTAIISSQTVTLCDGQSVMVGSNTYTAAGTYIDVLTAQNTCDSTVTTNVIVNGRPTITVNSGAICAGQSFTMNPSGALTYTYSSGTNIVSPTSDATYSVSGTDANGCVSSTDAISSVTVNALPSIMVMTTNTLLCTGETATLSAMGATSYTWSTNETTSDIVVTPTIQTTYTLEGSDNNGCVNMTTITQDVSLCTGIIAVDNLDTKINVYPNPSNGIFVLELNTTSLVMITNTLGQLVFIDTMVHGNHNLNIQNQSPGIYFIKVVQNGKQHVVKLVKE